MMLPAVERIYAVGYRRNTVALEEQLVHLLAAKVGVGQRLCEDDWVVDLVLSIESHLGEYVVEDLLLVIPVGYHIPLEWTLQMRTHRLDVGDVIAHLDLGRLLHCCLRCGSLRSSCFLFAILARLGQHIAEPQVRLLESLQPTRYL